MPQRHRGRFSRLEAQLRAAGGQAKEGSELGNFKLFRENERHATRRKTTKLTAAQRKRYGISIAPFNTPAGAKTDQTKRFVASVTGFSLDGQKSLLLEPADVGWDKQVDAQQVSAQTADYFFPALLKPFVPSDETGKSVESGITGNKYLYKSGSNFSIPFGRTTTGLATDAEEDRRVFLAEKARATGKTSSIGYDPEVFRGIREPLDEVPGVGAAP